PRRGRPPPVEVVRQQQLQLGRLVQSDRLHLPIQQLWCRPAACLGRERRQLVRDGTVSAESGPEAGLGTDRPSSNELPRSAPDPDELSAPQSAYGRGGD